MIKHQVNCCEEMHNRSMPGCDIEFYDNDGYSFVGLAMNVPIKFCPWCGKNLYERRTRNKK